jgi:hypothetical protein
MNRARMMRRESLTGHGSMRGRVAWVGVALGAVLSVSGPAGAHHSFAMFDATKAVTLKGTVREFQWTNPHAWIYVLVPGEDGKTVEWGLETGAPTVLFRQGWRSNTLKAGDKIEVIVRPRKDGTPSGQLAHRLLVINDVVFKPDSRDVP